MQRVLPYNPYPASVHSGLLMSRASWHVAESAMPPEPDPALMSSCLQSTLLKLMTGDLSPTAGTVQVSSDKNMVEKLRCFHIPRAWVLLQVFYEQLRSPSSLAACCTSLPHSTPARPLRLCSATRTCPSGATTSTAWTSWTPRRLCSSSSR